MDLKAVPDYAERKGSLLLRAPNMNYSRAVLNSNWHQARESEPKDYDISEHPIRNLKWSTYKSISDYVTGPLPPTTYEAMTNQIFLKPEFSEHEVHKLMVTPETFAHQNLERQTGHPQSGYGAILPKHHPDHNKMYTTTSYGTDYVPPLPYQPSKKVEFELDPNLANKKCLSQFTDKDNHRRSGRNTWHDESGLYANNHHRLECGFYPNTNVL